MSIVRQSCVAKRGLFLNNQCGDERLIERRQGVRAVIAPHLLHRCIEGAEYPFPRLRSARAAPF